MIRANTELATSPPGLFARVNNDLCEQSRESGMFVSLVLGLLNVQTGELELCNAGHPAPVRINAAGEVETLPTAPGVALGAWRDQQFRTTQHQLAPGDTVLFFTDGVTEALDADNTFYTAARLDTFLQGMKGEPVEQITRALVQDVRQFCGETEQADDLTVLAVRWNGKRIEKPGPLEEAVREPDGPRAHQPLTQPRRPEISERPTPPSQARGTRCFRSSSRKKGMEPFQMERMGFAFGFSYQICLNAA